MFGQCQNCQNSSFKWPYQQYKAILEKYFFVKMLTRMLLLMYQVFSSLQGHPHFLCLFLAFYGKPFYDSPYMFHKKLKNLKKNGGNEERAEVQNLGGITLIFHAHFSTHMSSSYLNGENT